MMKLMLALLFMIPLILNWWLVLLMIMILTFIYLNSCSFYNFTANLGSGLGLDTLSYSLIALSLWVVFLMFLASFIVYNVSQGPVEFSLLLLLLLLMLMITFSVTNMLSFYIAFEATLIPTLFLIFGWGYQPERLMAGYYFLFYTLFASFPLLVGILYILVTSGTLNFWLISLELNLYLIGSLLLAFLFKLPMVFVHFWLPSAHVEAPISGSMVLAGVLLKLGGYGLCRVYLFVGIYMVSYSYILISMSLVGILLVGLLCLFQSDVKSLIAYSSVAHMGLVICGIASFNLYGLVGSLILMLGHGFCSSGLFCLANMVYERTHSRSLFINSGLMVCLPLFALVFFLFCANNMACPPSLNLLGEIYIINSVMSWGSLSFGFLMFSSFFSCCYSIYLFSVICHGTYNSSLGNFTPLNLREFLLVFLHWVPLNLLILKSGSLFSLV